MQENHTVILNRLSEGRKELMGYHRFINNDKVSVENLTHSMTSYCSRNVVGRDIICLQDTTEYNYQHHLARIKAGELGPVGNNIDIGFFAHPMLVIDSEHQICLGYGSIELWHRDFDKQDKHARGYSNLPIEEKESYRWITNSEKTKQNLSQASHMTIIADRESDIYQLWDRIPDKRTDLIIRSRSDRKLYQSKESLFSLLSGQEILGQYKVHVNENKKTGRSKHKAILSLRSVRTKIKRPRPLKNDSSEYIAITAIEVIEHESSVNPGEPPVHWYLLTTCEVTDYDQAKEIVRKYTVRWQIEQLFRISKHQGLDLESSQIETGRALMNLCLLALHVSMKILQLTQARDNVGNVNANIAFTEEQIVLLSILAGKYQGNTDKQKNPFKTKTLAWASWIIARMGGWKGYNTHAKAGPITIHRGMVRFYDMFSAWKIFEKNV